MSDFMSNFFGLLERLMESGDPNLEYFGDNVTCARYFDRVVFPRLQAAFPDQELPLIKGRTFTKIRFRQQNVWEGTEYDGISIAIPYDRIGNSPKHHGGSTDFIPEVIEGLLTLNGKLQNEPIFSWYSVEDMIEEIHKLKDLSASVDVCIEFVYKLL